MTELKINVKALVSDAVKNLETVNDKIADQDKAVNRLAKAQHDLEASSLKLADAQTRLAKNTDPAKQHELEGAVLSARVALDKQGDEVNRLAREYTGLEGGSKQLADAQTSMVQSLVDVKAGVDLAVQAFGYMQQAFDATVIRAANWGDSMGDLASLTGESVEDTSRLAATLELVGVDADKLGRILKTMTSQGLNLNLKTLMKLNEEYNALQDPVERNAFLFKNFGKAAEDMAEVMGRSQAELEALTAAAERSGKVIGEQAAAQAEKLNVQLAIAQQQLDGVAIKLGGAATQAVLAYSQAMRSAILGFARFSDQVSEGTSVYDLFAAGLITSNPKLLEFAAAFDEVRGKAEAVAPPLEDNTRATNALRERWEAMGAASTPFKTAAQEIQQALSDLNTIIGGSLGQSQDDYYTQQGELAQQARDLKAEIDKLTESNGQYYETVQGNGMSTAELELATAKLARAQADLAEETDPVKQAQLKVEIEKQQTAIAGADKVVGGYIDNSEKISELTAEYDAVTGAIKTNRDTFEEANARIVFGMIQQRMAADGLQDGEITALAEIGREWGIYDQKTADVLAAVDTAITNHGSNAQAIIGAVGGAIIALPTEKTFTYHVRVDNPNNLAIGSEDPSYSPSVQGNPNSTVINDDDEPVGPGYAQGGSFIVPGSGSGDRPYTVNLTPGERVDVTPVNQVGKAGSRSTVHVENINITAGEGVNARSLVDDMLRELARQVRAQAATANW